MLEKKCPVCGRKFECERRSARFCSSACRQEYHRLKGRAFSARRGVDLRHVKDSDLLRELQQINEVLGKFLALETVDPFLLAPAVSEQLRLLRHRMSAAALVAEQLEYQLRFYQIEKGVV